MHVQEMISTHPSASGRANDELVACIEACYDGANSCIVCADACLAETDVQRLVQCIRLNFDCADACLAAGTIASRRAGSNVAVIKSMLATCAEACRVCAEECEMHAQHYRHCRICADVCRRCETECRSAAESISPKLQ